MSAIVNIFNLILYQPLFNALILLYLYLPGQDFGVAIIVLTLAIRLLLYPLMAQSIRSQKAMTDLQPKIQEIQRQYKDEKEKQAKAMMELYKREKFNPFGGCLPLLLQLPILLALFQVFRGGLQPEQFQHLYGFVSNPGAIDSTFLGIIDLAQAATIKVGEITQYLWPNIILAVFAGLAQFIQSKMLLARPSGSLQNKQMGQFSSMMQKQTLYLLPLFTIFILWGLPSAIGLYWSASTVFSIFQQYLIFKAVPKAQIVEKK